MPVCLPTWKASSEDCRPTSCCSSSSRCLFRSRRLLSASFICHHRHHDHPGRQSFSLATLNVEASLDQQALRLRALYVGLANDGAVLVPPSPPFPPLPDLGPTLVKIQTYRPTDQDVSLVCHPLGSTCMYMSFCCTDLG